VRTARIVVSLDLLLLEAERAAIRPTGSAEKYYTHIIRKCIVAPLE